MSANSLRRDDESNKNIGLMMSNSGNYKTIYYDIAEGIATLTLNRPEKLNAVNSEMDAELNHAMDQAEKDDKVRVILLRGKGRAFSAGFDLTSGEGIPATDVDFWREELRRNFDLVMRFWDCPKPTIAAVHGYCLGSAMEMAVACDITVAAEGSLFGAPEVKFGSGIVALILPWLIGVKAAKELLLTGDDKVPVERALSLGLINKIVMKKDLLLSATEVASKIARNDQLAVKLTKQAINRSFEIMGMRDALLESLELDVTIETTQTPDLKEFNSILKDKGLKAAMASRDNNLSKKGKS